MGPLCHKKRESKGPITNDQIEKRRKKNLYENKINIRRDTMRPVNRVEDSLTIVKPKAKRNLVDGEHSETPDPAADKLMAGSNFFEMVTNKKRNAPKESLKKSSLIDRCLSSNCRG